MRLPLRAGIVFGLAALAACGQDAPSPVDFNDPAAISANLSSVDSAFDSDVFRSFGSASVMLDVATAPAFRPTATLIETLRPQLVHSGARMFLPSLRQAQKLQTMIPSLSVSAAQGRIVPDSMYGRVFEWDASIHQYSYQGTTVANLDGVRFVLYATDLSGAVVEPVAAIGTLDIIDQSTTSKLQLQVLVKNSAATTTYVDYTASVTSGLTSASASVSGSISNGLSGGNNKTLTFDQTLSVNGAGAQVHATFALNNPAITVMLNESASFDDPNLVSHAGLVPVMRGMVRRSGRLATLRSIRLITRQRSASPSPSMAIRWPRSVVMPRRPSGSMRVASRCRPPIWRRSTICSTGSSTSATRCRTCSHQ